MEDKVGWGRVVGMLYLCSMVVGSLRGAKHTITEVPPSSTAATRGTMVLIVLLGGLVGDWGEVSEGTLMGR